MKEPLSPVFGIIVGTCIGDFPCLDIEDEYDETEEIHLEKFFFRKIIYMFVGKRCAIDKFLDNIGCFFSFIFRGYRCTVTDKFSREKIVIQRKFFPQNIRYLYTKSLLYDIAKDGKVVSKALLKKDDVFKMGI